MGEMKKFGRVINHYEQDKNWLKFCSQDDPQGSQETENISYSKESYLKKIFSFATSFTKLNERHKKKA